MPPKTSDQTAGEKLLSLHTLLLLQGDRPVSLGSLATALKCSKQTVLRLLAQLEASGYGKLEEPIRKGREHFYRLSQTKAGLLNLGARELSMLALSRNLLLNLLPQSGFLAESGEKRDGPSPAEVNIFYKGYIDYAPYEEQYEKLLQALQRRVVCQVSYRKSIFQPAREFCFAPMRILIYHETLSVAGWEVAREGPVERLYPNWLWLYIQRFCSVELTRRSSVELPDIDFQDNAGFGLMAGEPFLVKLKFSASAANYVRDRRWTTDQTMVITDDNSLILEMTARNEREILGWVLSFGTSVTVLEPEWLKKEVASTALAIAAQYGS